MTLIETLQYARSLIKQGWCQRKAAANKQGRRVNVHDPEAVKFCLLGAVLRAAPSQEITGFCLQFLSKQPEIALNYDGSITSWNDATHRKKREVLAFLDNAIAKLKEQQA